VISVATDHDSTRDRT